MATPTYDLLASTTLTSSASSVTFSSIDQSYGDLILVSCPIMPAGSHAVREFYLRVNADTGNKYRTVYAYGNGSSTVSGSASGISVFTGGDNYTLNPSTLITYQFQDYSSTDKHKSVLSRSNVVDSSSTRASMAAQRWASTSAISSITALGSDFAAGSTFNLYGVAK